MDELLLLTHCNPFYTYGATDANNLMRVIFSQGLRRLYSLHSVRNLTTC